MAKAVLWHLSVDGRGLPDEQPRGEMGDASRTACWHKVLAPGLLCSFECARQSLHLAACLKPVPTARQASPQAQIHTWNGCVAHQSTPGPCCRLAGDMCSSLVPPAQWLNPRRACS